MITTAPATATLVTAVVETYQALIKVSIDNYTALHQIFSDDARNCVELIMLIDTVFLAGDGDSSA